MQKFYYGFYFAGLAAVNAVMWLYVITLDDFERLKEKESQVRSAEVSGFYAINFQVTN
jgi:hypothetical protein